MDRWEIEEKLRKLAPVNRQLAEVAWLLYISSDVADRATAELLLDCLLSQQAGIDFDRRIVLDPPHPPVCRGEYKIGTVVYPPGQRYCSFGLREQDWIHHVLAVGSTGAGKTNWAFSALRLLQARKKPFLVFDWKRNYRDLLQLEGFSDLRVLTVGRDTAPFRFNPLLPPPGVSPGLWLLRVVDILKHAYFVGEGVEYLLRQGIDQAYERAGWHDVIQGDIPTFQQVRMFVLTQRLQGRMSLWKASSLRVLESLCFRHGLGPVLNCEKTTDQADVFDRPTILELDALADVDKVFLTEILVLWLYEYRKNKAHREKFQHALIVEEAHHVLSEHKERSSQGETIMETCLRQIREFGEAVILIDQEPSKVSNSIKANTGCKITFNLGNGKDITDISRCLGLSREEAQFITYLPVGSCIVHVQGRTLAPVHVRCPLVRLRKGLILDADLMLRNQRQNH